MKLRYKYRIYPTTSQAQQMISVGGSVRFLYNHFLKLNIDSYQQTKQFVWYNDMAKILVDLKKQYSWLQETYSQVLQQSLKDLESALRNMKKTGAGFPKFKSKYTTPVSFRYQQHTSVISDKLRLPKIGDIKIVLHRDLPQFKGVTIYQTARGWYASFVIEQSKLDSVDTISKPVGIDVNSKSTALSTGELITNPKHLSTQFKHIKIQQPALLRKQKTSRNRQKQRLRLARIHDQVRCQRLDHIHQTSARIAKSHDLVSVETLKIDEMRRNNRLAAKAIADAGWATLANAIAYKCHLRGHHFIRINQWLPSSKTCSACGHKKSRLDLRQREYHCDSCGITLHRDINAAVNIKNWGLQQWSLDHSRQELPDAPVDVTADILVNCGEMSASQMKQEVVGL